jgi:hypothetical protein
VQLARTDEWLGQVSRLLGMKLPGDDRSRWLAVYAAELEKNRPDVVGFSLETIVKLVISVLNRVIAKRLFPLQSLGKRPWELGCTK